jgi:protein-disulfide isomerase
MKNSKVIFIVSALVLIAGFFVAKNIYKGQEAARLSFLSQENADVFVRDHSPQYGDKDAKIYITEFLDPECESCRAFYPQIKELLKKYEGKVKLVVRYATFHRNSIIAVRALEAARKQGKYWEALELLFRTQPQWGDHHNPKPELMFEFLPQLGLNMEQLREDMKSPHIQKIVEQDMADLKKLNVRGTPTFFVNGKPPANFGLFYLKELIDSEIKIFY